MLAAIVPASQQAWFFKVVGPIAMIDQHEQAITDFFTSLRIDDTGRARWELPEGWKEDPPSGLRAATLWVPAEGKPIEISVTTLGWAGTQNELLQNVNRWRGQMQLPPVDLEGLADCTRELAAGDAKITLADLRGKFQSSGMMGPFAGGQAGAASRAAQTTQNPRAEIPAGHPPIDANDRPQASQPSESPPAAGLPTFEVPASWEQRPPASSMRKAEFGISEGTQEALVTVSDFPTTAPNIAELLPNVNRWRSEIGLGEITTEGLAGVTEKIEIDHQPATYVRLVPDPQKLEQSRATEATLAAMVKTGDRVWFVKMRGPRSLVIGQEDQFKAFLQSVRFPAAGGANHGN
jgi:hypothetical protein